MNNEKLYKELLTYFNNINQLQHISDADPITLLFSLGRSENANSSLSYNYGITPNILNTDNRLSLLSIAIEQDNPSLISNLLENGADPNYVDPAATPLCFMRPLTATCQP